MGKKKNEIWKYTTIIFLILSVASFLFSVLPAPIANEIPDHIDRSLDIRFNFNENHNSFSTKAFTEGNVDQTQFRYSYDFAIGYISPMFGCYQQPIINDREPMLGFGLYISKSGTPSHNLIVGVMHSNALDPTDGNSYHQYFVITPDMNIPTDPVLLNFEFDVPYNHRYSNIVAISLDDPSDSGKWLIAMGDENPTPWILNTWHWDQERWVVMTAPFNSDMCFVTYTEDPNEPDPDPDPDDPPPSISITTTQWTSQALGIGFLGMCIASFTKYRWF